MAADDFQNTPRDQGVPDIDTSQSLSGNRPASGSRRATPGEVLSQGFQGAQNAGDFLGLDTEFTASQDPNQVFGADSPLDLVPPPSTFVDGGAQAGYSPQAAPGAAPMPLGDPAQEFSEAPSAFEFGEDLGSEDGEAAHGQEIVPSRRPLLVKALLVAGLVGGGTFYGSKLYSRFFGPSTEVAMAPKDSAPKPQPARTEAPVAVMPDKPSAEASQVTKAPTPDATPVAVTSTKEPRKPDAGQRSSTAPRPSGVPKSEPESSPEKGLPEGATSLPTALGTSVATRPRTAGFPDLESPEYAWASADLLEMIWRGNQVPLEAVQAPSKTLMPRVGNVRVFTTSGDVFDGRLYAVGQNRVWVDAQPGRIGLDGQRIEKIEVLGPADGQQAMSGQEPQITGKKRVRVRVPGGMLYGSVLKAEGEEVILALDDGGRVRVLASDIEELGSGRAVVVRR